jgi:hypothetical protein
LIDCGDEGGEDETAKKPQPGEDASEVVADGGEENVGGVAGAALEVASPEMTVRLQVSDEGLDGGSAAQFALDDAEDAALLSGDEDATRVSHIVSAISLVCYSACNIDPLSRGIGVQN